MSPTLRPLVSDDADAVLDLQVETFGELGRRLGWPDAGPPADRGPGLRRILHLVDTDPGGAWVGLDEDGAIQGAALALVRDGVWGLSLLVVRPGRQSNGMGSALLSAALEHGEGTRGGIILSSEDDRALRAYSRAGFALRPVVDAYGAVTRRPEPSPAVRCADWPADAPIVDAASRHVRGATHAAEVPNYLEAGGELLVHETGGWVASQDGSVKVLAARDEAIAAELLRTALARTPDGRRAAVDFIDARNQWAVPIVLDAGLKLRGSGAVFVRGEVGPMAPYIPSGAYL
jgi:GNAT superfamily N-acetyltransferase